MRRAIAAVLAAALLAGLTACGSSDGKPTVVKASPAPTVNPRGEFLGAAHEITFNGAPTDGELLAYPPQWCKGLDAGHSAAWLFDLDQGDLYPVGDEWGTVKQDADTLLVAGVKAYCPKNLAALTAELRAAGDY